MKSLRASLDSRMIQLVPSSAKNIVLTLSFTTILGIDLLALFQNLDDVTILRKTSCLSTLKTVTTVTIPTLMITFSTTTKTTYDKTQDVKMRTPIPTLFQVVTETMKNQATTDDATKIKHSYKPSHIAFTTLEKKGIIRKAKVVEVKGRKFPQYWLTEEGTMLALIEGASPKNLLAIAKEIYPDDRMLRLGLEMAPYIRLDVFRIALTALKTKGKLEPADLASIVITQMQANTPFETFTQALETLRKYPIEYNHFQQKVMQIQENFDKLIEIIENR